MIFNKFSTSVNIIFRKVILSSGRIQELGRVKEGYIINIIFTWTKSFIIAHPYLPGLNHHQITLFSSICINPNATGR